MKTRTKKTAKVAGLEPSSATHGTASTLPASEFRPLTLTILPKDLNSEARLILLPSIGDAQTKRLLVCPIQGIYEFTSVEETATTRSWLLTPGDSHKGNTTNEDDDDGHILKRPEILVATPIDALFIILSLMLKATQTEESSYLTCSDYIFGQEDVSFAELKHLMRKPSFNNQLKHLEARCASISDKLELGDDQDAMYRFSPAKLHSVLLAKAQKLASTGLPASMEEKFVRQALEKPTVLTEADEAELLQQELAQRSQTLTDGEATARTKSLDNEVADTPASIVQLQRIRIAYDYMMKAYVPHTMHKVLRKRLMEGNNPDFALLTRLEEEIKQLKQQSQALRTLSDNISRKRAIDDDEALAKAEDKRRKKDEEEKKKKSTSHGIKQLAKADTSGMKKLSAFFAKKPVK